MAITLGFDTAAAAVAMAFALAIRWLMTSGAPPDGFFAATLERVS